VPTDRRAIEKAFFSFNSTDAVSPLAFLFVGLIPFKAKSRRHKFTLHISWIYGGATVSPVFASRLST
jgi:hypothetical protein